MWYIKTHVYEYLHFIEKKPWSFSLFFVEFLATSVSCCLRHAVAAPKVCQFEAYRYVGASAATRMCEAHRKPCWLRFFFRLCGAYEFRLHWSGGAVRSWKSRRKTISYLHLPVCIYPSLLLGTCYGTLGRLSLLPLLRRMDVPWRENQLPSWWWSMGGITQGRTSCRKVVCDSSYMGMCLSIS